MPDDRKPGTKHVPAPKTFDIFKPGKGRPQPTSRPVILGHKPSVSDSTLLDGPARAVAEHHVGHALMSPPKEVDTQPSTIDASQSTPSKPPLVAGVPEQNPAPDLPQGEPVSPAEKPTHAEELAEPKPAPKSDTNELLPGLNQHAISEIPTLGESPATPEASKPTSAEDNTPTSNPDEASASGPAFDPAQIVVSHHGHASGRWLKVLLVSLLVILIAAAAIDALLDTGTWKPNATIPHTHLLN